MTLDYSYKLYIESKAKQAISLKRLVMYDVFIIIISIIIIIIITCC